MEITVWECFKVSHEITIAFLIMALPLLALGAGKLRRKSTAITWKVFGGTLSLLSFSGGLLTLFQPYLYPEAPVFLSFSLRLGLSLPLIIGGLVVLWMSKWYRITAFYHLPSKDFLPWIEKQIQKENLPLINHTEEYVKNIGWLRRGRFDPKIGRAWKLESSGPILVATLLSDQYGRTWMGSLGVQGKGNRERLDPLLRRIQRNIDQIEVKPNPVAGWSFIAVGSLILFAIIYGIYVVCFTPPPV